MEIKVFLLSDWLNKVFKTEQTSFFLLSKPVEKVYMTYHEQLKETVFQRSVHKVGIVDFIIISLTFDCSYPGWILHVCPIN